MKVGTALLVKQIFNVHWYKNKLDSPLARRLRLIALNSIMRSITSEKLAPEVKLAAERSLLEFSEWLDDEADDNEYEILKEQFDTYWSTKTWPGLFEVEPLPPGSPI